MKYTGKLILLLGYILVSCAFWHLGIRFLALSYPLMDCQYFALLDYLYLIYHEYLSITILWKRLKKCFFDCLSSLWRPFSSFFLTIFVLSPTLQAFLKVVMQTVNEYFPTDFLKLNKVLMHKKWRYQSIILLYFIQSGWNTFSWREMVIIAYYAQGIDYEGHSKSSTCWIISLLWKMVRIWSFLQ